MASPSSYTESWRLIALDSQHLRHISSHYRLTLPDLFTTTPSTQTSSDVEHSIFPLPPPITPDLIGLGMRPVDAQRISQAFLQAVVSLRSIYESQFHKADQSCQAIIRAKGPLIPNFRLRLRTSHVSHFLAKINVWSSKGVSITRHWLMQKSLNSRPSYNSLVHPPDHDEVAMLSLNRSCPSPDTAFFKLEIDDAGQADLIKGMNHPDIAKLSTSSTAEKDRHIQPLDSGSIDCWNAVELSSLFQQRTRSIKSDHQDVLQRYSPCSFPKTYPCPASVCQDASFKVLSRGLQRVMRRPSQAASTDKVIESLTHLHISNSGSTSHSDIHDNKKSLIPAFLLTPTSSPRPSPPTSHLINRPVIPDPLPTPPESPQSPTREPFTSQPAYSKRYNRKAVSLPKRRQIPGDVCKDGQPALTEEPSSVTLLSLPKTITTPPRTPIDQERPLSVITPPTSSLSPTAARKRKTAALPTRRVPSMMPNIVPTTSMPFAAQFAPLSAANVSSLSSSCTSVGPRSIISRTPSLVSLASIDSGPSSPSSNGLDTPPSTPPHFVTKFSLSISPSSSSSKSFTPKFDSAVSPGNLFQFSSAKQPKIFEAHLPSSAPPFGLSAGIKREEMSFSFAFGR
uniref:B2 mating type protein n=1 Tax=Heterobasidion araucariae TaxID=13564 RepID=S5RWK1_9AGAM|nr:b2 mating type protein [Heterobasidion araucariae]